MPSEKFSARLSIAARATPASSSGRRVAADDHRDGFAAGIQPAGLQRVGDRADVIMQAALREQAGGGENNEDVRQDPIEDQGRARTSRQAAPQWQ